MAFIDIAVESAQSTTEPEWWTTPVAAAAVAVVGVVIAQLVALWIAGRRHAHERQLAQDERRAASQRELLLAMHARAIDLSEDLTRGAAPWEPWMDSENIFARNAFGSGTKSRPSYRDRLEVFVSQRDLIDDEPLRAQLEQALNTYTELEEGERYLTHDTERAWSEAFYEWGKLARALPERIGEAFRRL